jgi:hypothetical protein
MKTRIHYRLADDANNGHSLWSGAVTVDTAPTGPEARKVIAQSLRLERLPANTLVVTDRDLKAGKWNEEAIRAATAHTARVPKKFKAFEDLPESFDEVQDLLKKLGL